MIEYHTVSKARYDWSLVILDLLREFLGLNRRSFRHPNSFHCRSHRCDCHVGPPRIPMRLLHR